jgi:hypothetical protein
MVPPLSVSQSISGKKISATPSPPAQNFSGRVWLIGKSSHAGKSKIL